MNEQKYPFIISLSPIKQCKGDSNEFADLPEYPFVISLLPVEEGGGYLIEFPDLPGCISDGETIEKTIANGKDAIVCWLETAKQFGDEIPEPGSSNTASGFWVQRVPSSIHTQLSQRAEQEGISLNTLVTTMLSEGLNLSAGSAER